MKRISFIFVTFWISFQVVVSEPDSDDEIPMKGFWDFEDLEEMETPLTKHFESFEDGPPPVFPESDRICHKKHIMCLSKTPNDATCAHRNRYGLVSFVNECDIYLQNCLIASYERTTGKKRFKEPYYYNGMRKQCKEYINQSYTTEDAVKLYFMIGRHNKTRRNGFENEGYLITTTKKFKEF